MTNAEENLNFSTFILCGGESKRMGQDKATYILNGQSFVAHIAKSLATFSTQIQLVSSREMHKNLGFPVITDVVDHKGPVGAITSALSVTNTSKNLIWSCDTPFVKKDFLNWMLSKKIESYDGVIPVINDKKMFLNALYSKECRAVFSANLGDDQLKVSSVLAQLKVNYVDVPNSFKNQLINVNSEKDLKLQLCQK